MERWGKSDWVDQINSKRLISGVHPEIKRLRYKLENRMELDIYIEDINTGIEYDGIVYHSSDEAKARDTRKDAFCKLNCNFINYCYFHNCRVVSAFKDRQVGLIWSEIGIPDAEIIVNVIKMVHFF